MENIGGFHVSMQCEVKSWSVFLSFYLLRSIKHAFELPDFDTVVASEVNGSFVTA